MEETKEKDESSLITALREEYENRLKEQEIAHQKELEQTKQELEEKHIKELKALVSGRAENLKTIQQEEKETEVSFFDDLLQQTRKKFNIKGD